MSRAAWAASRPLTDPLMRATLSRAHGSALLPAGSSLGEEPLTPLRGEFTPPPTDASSIAPACPLPLFHAAFWMRNESPIDPAGTLPSPPSRGRGSAALATHWCQRGARTPTFRTEGGSVLASRGGSFQASAEDL